MAEDGYHAHIPITTRPMRPSEIADKHYHFIESKAFESDNDIIIKKKIGNYYYGNYGKDLSGKGIIVTTFDVAGVNELISLGYSVKAVFLNIDKDTRAKRMLGRGDSPDQVSERLLADEEWLNSVNISCPNMVVDGGSISVLRSKIYKFLKGD